MSVNFRVSKEIDSQNTPVTGGFQKELIETSVWE